ncbi:phage minor head protein [Ponticoccus litoralis]|uniref:Phage minor head protein n=1 Tax=Ponticoccus litoralis TaxID=422297 RepID=A0AAW9SB44_9RHOB
MPDSFARLAALLAKIDSDVAKAFVESAQGAMNAANRAVLEQAIEQAALTGNVDGIADALGFGPEAFDGYREAIEQAFRAGAAAHIASAPMGMVRGLETSFQGYHPGVIQWIDQNAAQRVATEFDTVREAVRTTFTRGIEQNRGYRKISLDIVGRIEGNMRRGGVIGLTPGEASYVSDMREALNGDDVGSLMRNGQLKRKFWIKDDGTLGTVYSGTTRDRRFDRTIVRALRGDVTLTQADIERITSRYSDGLLRERGRRIARTEGNQAMAAGRAESTQQMIDRGDALASEITKKWKHTARPGQRDNHAAMNGETVQFDQPYSNGMMRPHDPNAPASERINCGCIETYRTAWDAVARRRGTL